MSPAHFILATAGHVDHGKSALVKALTGTDPDRLPEEKARGITIDLGFAHLALPAPAPPDVPPPSAAAGFEVGIIDVPGHEDFVKNMVAGVGSIDLALFVVAADDGWMPQTEEHLQILEYLGVTRAVVALTKIDLVQGSEAGAVAAVREQLAASAFADAPIVGTSTVTGQGFTELKTTLTRSLTLTPPPRDVGKPRLPVDRVFSLRGIGTVVTGTLSGGTLRRGQAVVIQPCGRASRIRALQNYGQEVEVSGPGRRTALNLPDVEAHSATQPGGVARGDVLTLAELGGPATTLEVVVQKSPRLREGAAGGARPVKHGGLVRVHYGSADAAARLLLLDPGELRPGERRLGQLRFEKPVFACAGDRFILRDWAERATLAGGVVLDAEARRRDWRGTGRRQFLEARARALESLPAFILAQLARDGVVHRARLLVRSRFSAVEVAAAAGQLVAAGKLVAAGELLADASWWKELCQRAAARIEADHEAHPERQGLPLSDLRAGLGDAAAGPGVFEALIADLGRNGFLTSGVVIRRGSHRPALPAHLEAAGNRLRAALAAKPFDPPSRKELAPDTTSQQALRFLLETGEAVEIGSEVVLAAEAFGRAKRTIGDQLRAGGPATVSALRQALGSSRRILVPLLERLDREGFTRRQGDVRVLGKHAQ